MKGKKIKFLAYAFCVAWWAVVTGHTYVAKVEHALPSQGADWKSFGGDVLLISVIVVLAMCGIKKWMYSPTS
jgi:hypothetical protein